MLACLFAEWHLLTHFYFHEHLLILFTNIQLLLQELRLAYSICVTL